MNGSYRFEPDRTDYPAVRRVMGSQRVRLDDTQLEDLIESMFPESDAGDVEDFMRDLQSLARKVAPLAQRALPGVMKGAASGAAVAGPWGAIAGGLGGGVATLVGGGKAAPARPAGSPPRAAAATAAAVASAAPAAPAGPATTPLSPSPSPAPDAGAGAARPLAAAQLLALLSRPETTQALLAMLMGGTGKPSVAVGARTVPAPAFANAIAELASETAAAWSGAPRQATSDYLLDDAGDPRGDIYNPSARAALLLSDLADVADSESLDDEAPLPLRGYAAFDSETADDPIDGYEAALEDRSRYDD
ncbi:hypothetical protein [Brevundimonas sp.]|uniref:hypothetical protein n=1 Tax=Brevundimonas sp. TaxID=1871086 RepID=UPI00272EECB9|nr:hypothetical protein [Brevundimonas sp.]MDP1913225.1 hypothetical protein [Brevundimonas sp.]